MTAYAPSSPAEPAFFSAPVDAKSPDDDFMLVRSASGGNVAAFEAIMRRHNRALFRTARSILKNDADAEEVVQDAYVSAYRALPTFRLQCALRTWLTRIVINHALERLRSRKRNAGLISMDSVVNIDAQLDVTHGRSSIGATPEETAIREETRRLLEQRIDDLPRSFRTVFVMRAVEEMSVEETAECLGIPEATVRTRYFRARQLLRQSFGEEPGRGLREAFAFDGERCDRIVWLVLTRLGVDPAECKPPCGGDVSVPA